MFRFGAIVCKLISEHYSKVHIADFASDGLEVLRRVGELQPDLVLLNISLPKLSIETARKSGNPGSAARLLFGQIREDASSELLPSLESVLVGKQYLSRRAEDLENMT